MLLAGLAVAIGANLEWLKVSAERAPMPGLSIRGHGLWPGQVALVCGLVLIAGGAVVWLLGGHRLARSAAVLALFAALATAGLAAYVYLSLDTQVRENLDPEVTRALEQERGHPLSEAELREAKENAGFKGGLGLGLYIAGAGGLVGAFSASRAAGNRVVGVEAPPPLPPPQGGRTLPTSPSEHYGFGGPSSSGSRGEEPPVS